MIPLRQVKQAILVGWVKQVILARQVRQVIRVGQVIQGRTGNTCETGKTECNK